MVSKISTKCNGRRQLTSRYDLAMSGALRRTNSSRAGASRLLINVDLVDQYTRARAGAYRGIITFIMQDDDEIERIIARYEARVSARKAEREARRRAWRHRRGQARERSLEHIDPRLQLRPVCGATTRSGTPCRRKAVPGKVRCPNHGGMSTGPKTAEGRKRIAEAQRRRWAIWRNEAKPD